MKPTAFLKISLMVLALIGVIYIMKSLNSGSVERNMSDPQSALGILIGAELRPLNWCPAEVNRLILFDSAGKPLRSYGANPELSRFCELMVGGFQTTEGQLPEYVKRIVASNAQGEEKVLEQSQFEGVYRVQGMPFSSPMLSRALKSVLDQ